jgi:hypothetical protein
VIAGLPEGEVKETNVSRKKKMEYRLFTLEEQSDKYGMLALLEKETQKLLCSPNSSKPTKLLCHKR